MEVLTARRLRKVMQRVPRCDTVELSAPGGEGGGQIGVAEIVNHRIIVEPPSPPLVFSRQNHRHRLSPARPAAQHYRGIAIAAGVLGARLSSIAIAALRARAAQTIARLQTIARSNASPETAAGAKRGAVGASAVQGLSARLASPQGCRSPSHGQSCLLGQAA